MINQNCQAGSQRMFLGGLSRKGFSFNGSCFAHGLILTPREIKLLEGLFSMDRRPVAVLQLFDRRLEKSYGEPYMVESFWLLSPGDVFWIHPISTKFCLKENLEIGVHIG